jgi:predicted O-methyltransferase YrrM
VSVSSNLRTRMKLMRAALTKRFIYPDVVEVALGLGDLPVEDVAADLDPIELLWRVEAPGPTVRPDFSRILISEMLGAPADRADWSSERCSAEFLGRLAAVMQAQTVIEVGCFIGYTTAHLTTALRNVARGGRVHFVDCEKPYLETTYANLQRLGLADLGTAHLGTACDTSLLAALPDQADLIFIDTTHSYEDTLAEIATYAPRLSARGCLALHDSIRFPGVRRAMSEVRDQFQICTFATERGNGLSVLVPR